MRGYVDLTDVDLTAGYVDLRGYIDLRCYANVGDVQNHNPKMRQLLDYYGFDIVVEMREPRSDRNRFP